MLVSDQVDHSAVERIVVEVAEELDHFASNLPFHLRLTDESLNEHAEKGQGSTFVALHLAFFHYSTLLYFYFLDRPKPSSAIHAIFADRCKNYAIALSELLEKSMERPGCEALYVVVGHLTSVSSSVLLHTLLFGEESQLPQARHHLQVNFKKLLELNKIWPKVEKEIDKLFLFQDYCFQVVDSAHRVDAWMVKFLLNCALPLERRQALGYAECSGSTLYERSRTINAALSTLREGDDTII